MKKSELKEMIKSAMSEEGEGRMRKAINPHYINSLETDEDYEHDYVEEANDSKKGNSEEQKRMEGAIRDDRDHIKNLEKDIKDNEDKLAKLKDDYKEDVSEAKEVDVEDNEDINIDIEDEVDIDDESSKSEIEVDSELAGEDSDISAVLGLLTKAQEQAKDLGDEKLMDQIGNTITYYTRAHVVAEEEGMDPERFQGSGGDEVDSDSIVNVTKDNPAEDAEIGFALDEMAAGGLEEKSAGKKLFAEFKKDGLKPNYVADVRKLSDGGEAKDMVHIEPGEGSVEVSSSSNQDKIAQAIKSAGFDVSKKEDNVGDYKLSVFTVDVKNVKEELNEEFKRFQKLAGIIK